MFDTVLYHYGTKRHSGRYPYGSGEDPYQHESWYGDRVQELKSKGITDEKERARLLGMSTTELRARLSAEKNARMKDEMDRVDRFIDKGYSIGDISAKTGIPESTIRSRLSSRTQERAKLSEVAEQKLRESVDKKKYIDVGPGIEQQLGISRDKLNKTVAKLKDEGYTIHNIYVDQLGTQDGNKTTVKVLAHPDATIQEVYKNKDKIGMIDDYKMNAVSSEFKLEKPKSIDSKRIQIRYAEDGGERKDGVIELRRGVEDISLGGSQYAQVRIAVDGTHYLKGMAMYSDNMPKGVDIVFNTNKSKSVSKMDVLKKLSDDPDNPFGATIKVNGQRKYIDQNGKEQLSVINKVNEEGDWNKWSKSLASQMLSKQPVPLAKKQLSIAQQAKREEFNDIVQLTNPTLKKYLLNKFADDCDASAVHLKAAALPRQASHVILPIESLKDNEIYAPKYNHGERIVLIRYPHAGKFEIPELVVNNKNKEARSVMNNAADAVGINHNVAARLSGADFDGDTVLVIPNNNGAIKTAKALEKLKNFDPHKEYAGYEGMPVITGTNKQKKMGEVSNLITDMTLKEAPLEDIALAVRHSMVIIDAEKHKLDYRRSERENNIAALKVKYQGGTLEHPKGASTIISKAKSEARVPVRKEVYSTKNMTPDELKRYKEGEKIFRPTGESYVGKNGKTVYRLTKSTKMAEEKDARNLMSKDRYPMEIVYADYANAMKALGNEARKVSRSTKDIERSSTARVAYKNEVDTLTAKLNNALKNSPYERKAQLVANVKVEQRISANPSMSKEDKKKLRGRQLQIARDQVGAKKERVDITPKEWEAIQAGAISKTKLNSILDNTDLDKVKQLATPHTATLMTPSKISLAKSMANRGYTISEIADRLGVSTSTVVGAIN